MRKSRVCTAAAGIAAAVVLFVCAAASGAAEIMPVSEVKPDMAATMLTVVSGAKPSKFDMKIIAVNRKGNAGGDMIIARLLGDEMKHMGVAAGMSGSPVYIDGKLVGALAWAWSFSKDPICGITPIQDMMTELREGAGETGGGAAAPRGQGFRSVLDAVSGKPAAAPAQRVAGWQTAPVYAPGLGEVSLEPVATPVLVSGFTAGAREALRRYFEDATGMRAVSGVVSGGSAADVPGADALEPGGVLAIPLMVGDFEAAAIGTVTWREGADVLGFGHPMFNEGTVNMPLAGGVINHVLANQTVSFKMGDPSKIVGSITVDGRFAVRGTVGAAPEMIPVKVRVTDKGRGTSGTYEVKVLKHDTLTYGLVSSAVMNAIAVVCGEAAEATVRIRTRAAFSGGAGSVDLEDMYYLPETGYIYPEERLVEIASNPFRRVRLESAEIEVDVDRKQLTAEVASVSIKSNAIRVGDTLEAVVELKGYSGASEYVPVKMKIPRDAAPGLYKFVAVAAGGMYLRDTPPAGFEQYMEDVRGRIPFNVVAAVVVYPEKAPALMGETLRDAPATVRDMLGSGGFSGLTPVDKTDKVLLKVDKYVMGQALAVFTVDKAK